MNAAFQTLTKTNSASSTFTPARTGLLQRKCADNLCDDRKKSLLLQRSPSNQTEPDMVPPIVHEVLQSPGQPLDHATREFMEPRFGHDFSKVRVHTDAKAAESARAVNARAYTVGGDVVFGAGQYSSITSGGQQLLAHELTHTIQQDHYIPILQEQLVIGADNDVFEHEASQNVQIVMRNGIIENIHSTQVGKGILQRAETDTSAGCSDLDDAKKDVNDRINQALTNARESAGGKISLIKALYDNLGRNTSIGRTAIEDWAQLLGSRKVRQPEKSQTKYAGVTYRLWMQPLFPILNPTMRINNICISSDKLSHFLQQGYEYYMKAHGQGGSAVEAEEYGMSTEAGGFGLTTTGVFSNADLEANRQGLRFYEDLTASLSMTFDIANYISERWNEEANPSHYEASVGNIIWRNLLIGSWQGSFVSESMSQVIISNLNVGDDNVSISGQFSYKAPDGNVISGTILNGRITHLINSLGATTGVKIDFIWQSDTGAGEGKWTSKNESEMQGTWGFESSNNNGGSWTLTKSRVPLAIPPSSALLKKRCFQECEDTFDRCLRTSVTPGGNFCIAYRSTCMMNCSRYGRK